MADNDDSLYTDDPASPSPAAGNNTSPWYYRPSSGMNDWAAQLNKYSQSSNATGAGTGLTDAPARNDDGDLQEQSFDLRPASGAGATPDFLTSRLLQPQQANGTRDQSNGQAALYGTSAGAPAKPADIPVKQDQSQAPAATPVEVRRALPVNAGQDASRAQAQAASSTAGQVGDDYPVVTAVDSKHGYNYQPQAQLYLITANPDDPKNPVIRSVPDNVANIKNATVYINGMDNEPLAAAQLGLNHTGKSQFYMIYNPSNGIVSDLFQRALEERLGANLTVDKTAGELLKRFDLPSANVFAHSQGTMILNHAISDLTRQGVNMRGLNLNYDGSAANILASQNIARAAGAKIGRFGGNPADPVDNIVGLNTINPLRIGASIAGLPFIFGNRGASPHGEVGGGKYVRWLNDVPGMESGVTGKYP